MNRKFIVHVRRLLTFFCVFYTGTLGRMGS